MTTKNNRAYSYLRFSTPEQMKGDSFRRQTELSRKYAQEHGLELDETLSFQDLGVSAFRGANAQDGQLGAFLAMVDQGKVRPGATLLVESLDRLSRQSPYLAFRQLDDILRRGVRVVTLQDGKVYDAEHGEIAFQDLMMSLLVMQRAHEESITKSRRCKEAWKAKRDAAISGAKKLTGLCPSWLALDKEKQEFIILEEKAAIVRRIFEMTIDGMGNRSIARTLNSEGVSPFGKGLGWSYDYIRRILENEGVIGRFQPHKRKIVNGKEKRVPIGDAIDGYFPSIVSPEVFYKALRMRKGRKIPAGRASNAFSNLFTGFIVCGACGAPMHYENKGKLPKGGSYLVCFRARMKSGCKRHSWRYPQAQSHIMMNFNELDYREMFPDIYAKSQANASLLEDKIMVKETELVKVNEGLARLTDLLLERDSSPTLLSRLDTMEAQRDELLANLTSLKAGLEDEKDRMGAVSGDYTEVGEALRHYVKIERQGDPDAVLAARRRLHQLLKRIVNRISLTPSDGEDGLHGVIEVSFAGVDEYTRRIKVEKGQANSSGFKVARDEEQLDVTVVDAQWPPVDRIVSISHLIDRVLAK